MPVRCGIVGLPNVGKSTIFNALTAAGISAENYPFCTIEPNVGVVPVPDPRLAALHAVAKSAQVLPATVEFVDIAGLVRGASQGEGLGNQFLAHIRETDAVCHVVRCFEDPNVVHVDGGVDPVRDGETIATELGLADLETLERRLDRARKAAKTGDKKLRASADFLEKLQEHLAAGQPARTFPVPDEERETMRDCHLLTAKPILYVENVDEASLEKGNPWTREIEAAAAREGAGVVRLCGKIESELAELDDAEKQAFLEELGLAEPGLHRLVHATYELLGLATFFTAGPKATRAWTIQRGATAPEAAGTIHTDFIRGFIRAEVIAWQDYVASGGEAGAKAKGQMRLEGKEYVVRDGDVIYFRVAT